MPNILICSFERTKPNGHAKQPLASPEIGRGDVDCSDHLRLAAVHRHLELFLNVTLKQFLQCIIVLVLLNVKEKKNIKLIDNYFIIGLTKVAQLPQSCLGNDT